MSDVNQIAISADGQDITITIGDYSDANARAAISLVDAGGDGSLAYNNATGIFTYTGPSAAEVRAHFSAGSGISIASGVITNTRADTNTTYTQDASAATGGANLNLVGSDATTDTVKFASGTNVTVAQTNASTITISSTDTNTTYSISAETATGGANLRLTGSDASTDNVKFASGTGITVSRTDDSTVTIDTTITQYTDTLARQSISVATNTGDGDLTYNNTNGQFSYTGPGTTEYRAAIGVSNASGDGSLTYSTSTGVITYAGPTNTNYRGAVSATNTGTGYGSLAYDSGTGVFTYDKVTGANIRTEVQDGRNLTYTSSTLDLDNALVDVNSVTAATSTDLTATGDRLVLNTRDVGGVANQFLTLDSDGYRYSGATTTPGSARQSSTQLYFSTPGTTTEQFYRYHWRGDITSGSNVIPNARLYLGTDTTLTTPVNWVDHQANFTTHPIFGGGAGGGFDTDGMDVQRFAVGTRISSIAINGSDPTRADITLVASDLAGSANATATQADARGRLSHYMRNADGTLAGLIDNIKLINTVPTVSVGTFSGSRLVPGISGATGLRSRDPATYFSYTYTGTPVGMFTGRRVLQLQTANPINEHVTIPFGLGVGPGAVSTNRGFPSDNFDAIGINLYNPGTINGFAGKTVFNLTQFTDNSNYAQAGTATTSAISVEKAGGVFNFNHLRGNSTATANVQALNGDGMGSITWWGQAGTNLSYASSNQTPAGIFAKATEDHSTANAITGTHGTGIYLQHTPNSTGSSRPRTFLLAENRGVEIRAMDTITLKPQSKSAQSTDRSLNPTIAHTWLTASDYSLGSVNTAGTGAKVVVGITSASGVNGDVGLVLQRAVGNTANFELKLASASANTLTLVNNATSTTPVSIDNSKVAFAIPVQFPVYTVAGKPASGAVGQQICISDSAQGSNPNGMMAFWDTTHSRWSYIHDNSAV